MMDVGVHSANIAKLPRVTSIRACTSACFGACAQSAITVMIPLSRTPTRTIQIANCSSNRCAPALFGGLNFTKSMSVSRRAPLLDLECFQLVGDAGRAPFILGTPVCRRRALVGEGHERLTGLEILEADAPQMLGVALAGLDARECDGLIADNALRAVG